MSARLTAIADNKLGHVLGAVSEVGATGLFTVEQVVDSSGLALWLSPGHAPLRIPREELQTFAVSEEQLLVDPRAFIMVDGVPRAAREEIKSISVVKGALSVGFGEDLKLELVKAFVWAAHEQRLQVVLAKEVQTVDGIARLECECKAGEQYDVLLLVEGCRPLGQAGLSVS